MTKDRSKTWSRWFGRWSDRYRYEQLPPPPLDDSTKTEYIEQGSPSEALRKLREKDLEQYG